jgi:hypothetical protein
VRIRGRRGRTASYEFVDLGSFPDSLPEPDLAGERSRLDTALRDIEGFALEIDQPRWADLFREARDALDTGDASPWIESLFGDGLLEKEAFGLLAASFKADVFGGMGSWNDIPMDETIEQLAHAVEEALTASDRRVATTTANANLLAKANRGLLARLPQSKPAPYGVAHRGAQCRVPSCIARTGDIG